MTPPSRSAASAGSHTRQRETVLSMVRSEINSLYNGIAGNDNEQLPPQQRQQQPQPTATLPPKAATSAATNTPQTQQDIEAERWRKYHTAWQEYYRKYYEQYYVSEVQKNIASQTQGTAASAARSAILQPSAEVSAQPPREAGTVTQNEAMSELRQSIIKSAQDSAKKVRKSRHFIPILAALLVVVTVALLQYNQVLVAHVKAYVSPGDIEPQNIIVNPNASVPVGPEPKMIIPKINVDAPVVMNVGPTNEEQLAAMANGIAHVRYPGASAEPGEVGNAVFSAHSSSDWTDTGAYKFIFVQLERLAVDDVIYINYNSQRYSYKVYDTQVVMPTEIDALRYDGDKPVITLITCVPLGTAEKRLLIHAEQISPDPTGAPQADSSKAPSEQEAAGGMTGTAPTLIERMFGAR